MEHSDRFKQRASKRTTENFAFEGLNMHERPKRLIAGGENHHCVTPKYRHAHTLSLHVTDGRMLEKKKQRAPPSLFHYPHCSGQLGGRHSFFSAFTGKQKSVWDPSYTHVHVFRHTQPPHQKTVNATVGWSYFSSLSLPARRGTETFVEGESQGDNPNPAYQRWHADMLVVRSRITGEGSVKAVLIWKFKKK